jgi:hypothetical protein
LAKGLKSFFLITKPLLAFKNFFNSWQKEKKCFFYYQTFISFKKGLYSWQKDDKVFSLLPNRGLVRKFLGLDLANGVI